MKRNRAVVHGLVCLAAILAFACVASAAVTVKGTLLSPAGTAGAIRVQTGSGVTAIKPDAGAKIMRGQLGKDLKAATLPELAAGDHVVAVVNQNGGSPSIKAYYGKITGAYAKVLGKKLFFRTGKAVLLADSAQIVLPNGKIGSTKDLKAGSIIICRTNPVSGKAWTVVATGSGAAPTPTPVAKKPAIRSVAYTAPLPLKTGDTITVDLSGTPGGKATFEIKNLIPATPMEEVSPGTYRATANIPGGKSAQNAPLIGRLTVKGASAAAVQAARLVTVVETKVAPFVETVSNPPTAVEVPPAPVDPAPAPELVTTPAEPAPAPVVAPTPAPTVVETPKPLAPLVVSAPIDGEKITRAIIVSGAAEPASRVRVTVSYDNGLFGVLRLAGSYASQDVAVGNNGEFRMGPLALDGAMATRGLRFTIDVAYIDHTDAPVASVVVIGARG